MTIAACYLSTEGVILGADSTVTMGERYYNFAQKVFEFGDPGSTIGIVIWGLGSFQDASYRTFIAEAAEEAWRQKLASLSEVAALVSNMFWKQYTASFSSLLTEVRSLNDKSSRTETEQERLWSLRQDLSGGFCVGGRTKANRSPGAFEVLFNPTMTVAPPPKGLALGCGKFWGQPSLIERQLYGMDKNLFSLILNSGKWTGTPRDLFDLLEQNGVLNPPMDLPLREAVEWVYATIYTTIRAMKFSQLPPVCGGPIEVAVVTSDRPFRWVRHKRLGEAIATYQTKEERPCPLTR